jgi:hypothetical protein
MPEMTLAITGRKPTSRLDQDDNKLGCPPELMNLLIQRRPRSRIDLEEQMQFFFVKVGGIQRGLKHERLSRFLENSWALPPSASWQISPWITPGECPIDSGRNASSTMHDPFFI